MDPIWLGRTLADHDRRLEELERYRTTVQQTTKAVCKRLMTLCAVISLAVLAHAFPDTTVAKYADQFRLALMRR